VAVTTESAVLCKIESFASDGIRRKQLQKHALRSTFQTKQFARPRRYAVEAAFVPARSVAKNVTTNMRGRRGIRQATASFDESDALPVERGARPQRGQE
jgi:hypothetical protein